MAMQENGLNIIISLVLNDIKPLADEHMELALEIKVMHNLFLAIVIRVFRVVPQSFYSRLWSLGTIVKMLNVFFRI